MKRRLPLVLLLTVLAVASPVLAADLQTLAPALQARLDRAAEYHRFWRRIRDTLLPPQWLRDGDRFIYWSVVGPHGGTWVLVDARTGQQTPLLPPSELKAQLSRLVSKPLPLPEQFAFSIAPDQKSIFFPFADRAFALNITGGQVRALPATEPAALALLGGGSSSPDDRALATARDGGFVVRDRQGRTLVERRGEPDHDWELPDKAWSPDGRYLMVLRNDARAVHKIPIIDYSSSVEKVTLTAYPKTGTPLVKQALYVVEITTGQVTSISGSDAETYRWLAGWRHDGSEALVLQLSRDGKQLDLLAVTPATGTSRLVMHEQRPQSFIGALDFATTGWALQITPLPDNRSLLWMSERDGWRHIYRYDYAGKLLRQVTTGEFPVHQVVGVGAKGDAVLVVASAEPSAPYDRLPYRVDLTTGVLTRLSSESGVHRPYPAPSGEFFVDAHSSRTRPRSWEVVAADGRTRFRYAAADVSGLAAVHYTPPEGIAVLAADGVTRLSGVIYKPWDFDPAKRYAVIDVIYAGPFITVVPWSFVGNATAGWAGTLAQLGFVVVVIDARGTPGRSKAFQDANYGRLGQIEIPDHVAGLRQAAATRPWMDLDRVGIYGHSWGGYFSLRGMLTAPEVFKAGYAGAPGALEEEAIINEPNMGLPTDNQAGYAAGSNVALAANLRGALRIMHGTSDVNASLSTTMRMSQALIAAGKRFEQLIMPGQPHSPQGAAERYYLDDVLLFFVRTLGGPR